VFLLHIATSRLLRIPIRYENRDDVGRIVEDTLQYLQYPPTSRILLIAIVDLRELIRAFEILVAVLRFLGPARENTLCSIRRFWGGDQETEACLRILLRNEG
jgi:hypothetical protein